MVSSVFHCTAPPRILDGGNAHLMCSSLLGWIFTWYDVKLPVLDVGCRGMPRRGDFKSYFDKKGVEMELHKDFLGLDIIKYEVRLTVQADAHYLPFRDEVIGTIICFESLEHFRDPVLTFKEWSRVLCSGGVVAVTTVQGWPFHEEPEDHWRFKPEALRILLETNGFEAMAAFPMGGGCGLHSIAVGRKTPGFEPAPLDMNELMQNMGNVKESGVILR